MRAAIAATRQRFLPRTSMRWAVHSDPERSTVAELPCQPQVHVMVWAWCLYSSMTCLNGSTVPLAGLTGGRLFTGTPAREMASPIHRSARREPRILHETALSCSGRPVGPGSGSGSAPNLAYHDPGSYLAGTRAPRGER